MYETVHEVLLKHKLVISQRKHKNQKLGLTPKKRCFFGLLQKSFLSTLVLLVVKEMLQKKLNILYAYCRRFI